jgi:hypothetical protein
MPKADKRIEEARKVSRQDQLEELKRRSLNPTPADRRTIINPRTGKSQTITRN